MLNGSTNLHNYIDGSTLNGMQNGGYGVVVRRDIVTIHFWHSLTGTFIDSFSSDIYALLTSIPSLRHLDDVFGFHH